MGFSAREHILVPKHILLTKKEAKKILEELGATPEDLPKIHKNDPGIKELRPKKGDIVMIIRSSKTAGEAVYYRVVV
ncbi:MAG: DNA-directed RNA polymerase subunit H [Candidatus Diapherotrites archaeon]|nr:DNA-directed RNA polymerase subunit H [Candidatus Diapherotrites archaeon]